MIKVATCARAGACNHAHAQLRVQELVALHRIDRCMWLAHAHSPLARIWPCASVSDATARAQAITAHPTHASAYTDVCTSARTCAPPSTCAHARTGTPTCSRGFVEERLLTLVCSNADEAPRDGAAGGASDAEADSAMVRSGGIHRLLVVRPAFGI